MLRKISNKDTESSSSAEKLCLRKRVPNHTPKLPKSRDSSHHNACSTSVIVSPSRNAEQRLAKTQRPSTPKFWPSVYTKNERSVRRFGNDEHRRCEHTPKLGTPRLELHDSVQISGRTYEDHARGIYVRHSIPRRGAAWGWGGFYWPPVV